MLALHDMQVAPKQSMMNRLAYDPVPEELGASAGHAVHHVELAGKLAKQEQVKMGFQLYRPPTILAKASSEVWCSPLSFT